MTTPIYHYVYRITNTIKNKHYYGVRTCKSILPESDLGTFYFSSSTDKQFIKEQKTNPSIYKYKIIKTFNTRNNAGEYEVLLHNKFDVAINPKFYNKAKCTSSGFNTAGVPITDEHKKNISKAQLGIPFPASHKRNLAKSITKSYTKELREVRSNQITGINHILFKGWFIYNDLEFTSASELGKHVNVNHKTIKEWCTNNHKKVSSYGYSVIKLFSSMGTRENIVGKTFKDIGFSFIPI